jgi:DNA-binding XRE family transcriptional regulator
MESFRKHLNEELKDPQFKKYYEEEKELLNLSMKIYNKRKKLGISQKDLAKKAFITQQQLSKIENGINCTMLTFIKVCKALKINIL